MFLGKKHAYMQGLHCLLEVSSILSHSVHLESPTRSTFVCMCTSAVNRDAFNLCMLQCVEARKGPIPLHLAF